MVEPVRPAEAVTEYAGSFAGPSGRPELPEVRRFSGESPQAYRERLLEAAAELGLEVRAELPTAALAAWVARVVREGGES